MRVARGTEDRPVGEAEVIVGPRSSLRARASSIGSRRPPSPYLTRPSRARGESRPLASKPMRNSMTVSPWRWTEAQSGIEKEGKERASEAKKAPNEVPLSDLVPRRVGATAHPHYGRIPAEGSSGLTVR